jgi:hypothetical protein
MKKELELQLVEKYPVIFQEYGGDMRKTCMYWGFECGDGWNNLIHSLCQTINSLIKDKNIKVIAHQVKEKFGGLRFYYGVESKQTLMGRIDYRIRNFMFKHKWGVAYWKIIDFRKKFYKTISEKISDSVDRAEGQSYKICEICGKPGMTTRGGWIKTLCEECNKNS